MRTSFVAAAAIAATTSAAEMDAMAVPDFIAGFMFGLTGDNRAPEIEACYKGGSAIIDDVHTALADFKDAAFIAGAKEIGVIVNQFNVALADCENMDEDFAEMKAYADEFTDIGGLVKKVSKNWLLHKKKVKADIAQEETDWSAGSYFAAGEDTFDAINILVPYQSSLTYDLSIKGGIEFLGGFLFGFVGDNHMAEIEACGVDVENEEKSVKKAISLFKAGHKIKAIMQLKKLVTHWKTDLADCAEPKMADDVAALEQWAQIFKNPKKLIEKVGKSMLFHKADIEQDFQEMETDWKSGSYTLSGEALADLITVAIGPVEPGSDLDMDDTDLEFDIKAVPDFAAGFLYGMVGDNHLKEFETCFTSSEQLMPYMNDFISDLEAFHIISAFENFEKFLYHFQLDVAPCKNMGDDITAIKQWAEIFKEPTTLVETLGKHWLIHQKGIKNDITAEKADWAAKNYFKAGADIADAVTLAVGPIEKEEENVGLQLNLKGDAEFVAGFVYGMVGDNHLTEIEQCYSSTQPLVTDVEEFVQDLTHLHFIKAIKTFESFVYNFQIDTLPCHKLGDDVTSIKQWLAQFKDIPTLIETVGKHALVHMKGIKKDITAEKADWSAGNFFKAGADIADAVTLALGPMNETPAVPNRAYLADFEKNGIATEITHILAGLVYGLTEDNHLTELEACYAGGHEMEQLIVKAVHDFKHGGWDSITQGVLSLLIVALQLPQELHTCKNMSEDLTAIETWAKGFTDIKTLVPAVTKHFLFHKNQIMDDISVLKTDMSSQEYFQVGVEAADIVTILLPIQ